MNITLTGSLGNVSRLLTEQLVGNGHQVRVISSNAERIPAIRQLKAVPLIGSVEDPSFLSTAFQDTDGVYLMTPPNPQAPDVKHYMRTVGSHYIQALRENNVPYAVHLSSLGADRPDGVGPTGVNHFLEQALNQVEGLNVRHLRPGMFFTNFFGSMELIRSQNQLGLNVDEYTDLPLTHPRDIARIAFEFLHSLSFSGIGHQAIVGELTNGTTIAAALGKAIGKPDLRWVYIPDEQLLQALLGQGFSESMAQVYIIEMGQALREGKMTEERNEAKPALTHLTKLTDFADEFAHAYQQSTI